MNTRVRRKPPGERSEPHPNARSVVQHVQQYLAGAQNGEALEAWILAVGTAVQQRIALDELLRQMADRWTADALGGTVHERGESGATNARSREA